MTIPLMILAVCAVAVGWVGIPTTFPVLGNFSTNPLEHYIGGLAEALHIEVVELAFNPVPLATSLIVALGGLLAGWLVYRKVRTPGVNLEKGEQLTAPEQFVDPLERTLGPIYKVLKNKYYFDELYGKVFVKGSQRLANWLYRFDDLWVIDPIVDGVGKVGRRLSEIGQWFDTHIVDAAVNGIGAITGWFGSAVARDSNRQGAELPAGGVGDRVGSAGCIFAAAEVIHGGLFMTNSLLTIITFVPLLGALLVLLPWGKWFKLDQPREERLIKTGALAISLLPLGLAIVLWFGYNKAIGGMQYQIDVPWIPILNINYHLGVDGLSVPLVFLTTFLTTLGLYYSSRVIKVRVREFFFLFLMLEMGMLGVFVSLDLVLFYVFWEVGLVPMYFLIGIWGNAKDRPQYSAIKFFLYTLTGSVFMLLAILGIYFTTGTFDMLEAARLQPFAGNVVLSSLAFFAFFVAFAIKVPSWPFHTWLPDAHTAAPTAGSVILAGVLLKLGAYGMLRILLPIFPKPSTATPCW